MFAQLSEDPESRAIFIAGFSRYTSGRGSANISQLDFRWRKKFLWKVRGVSGRDVFLGIPSKDDANIGGLKDLQYTSSRNLKGLRVDLVCRDDGFSSFAGTSFRRRAGISRLAVTGDVLDPTPCHTDWLAQTRTRVNPKLSRKLLLHAEVEEQTPGWLQMLLVFGFKRNKVTPFEQRSAAHALGGALDRTWKVSLTVVPSMDQLLPEHGKIKLSKLSAGMCCSFSGLSFLKAS